ncbi:transpeptidase family protein [bacterium]|nr:transpeptidase family protein [bacterium]
MNEPFRQRRVRIGALTVALATLFVVAAARLAIVVLVDGPRLAEIARSEHTAVMTLAPVRGPIVDRNGAPLALSAETRSIYARPRRLMRHSTAADRARLAMALGLSDAELEARLGRGEPFVWLARHLPPARARAVAELGLDGVGAISEYKRYYPESNLAASVVGLAGMDGQGLSGVELQYDRLVRGQPVELEFYHDALGHPILDSPLALRAAEPGARLELTIDSSIQAAAENYLAAEVAKSGARRGTAIVLEPFTGEILALANAAGAGVNGDERLHDTAVQDAFEPGSTMKGLLGSIALADHVIAPSQMIYCEDGQWRFAGRLIHDDDRHGWLNLGGIIEVSSNIGAAKIALALGARRFGEGMAAFGLGHRTGIDLPGEAAGIIRSPSEWKPIELADHGFGQGVAVTPIQLAVAYAAIANGGMLMRPYVLKAAYDSAGDEILSHQPQAIRRAIPPAVAHQMNLLLRNVVSGKDGTARLARVADFTVAGKTGTAQMVNPSTGGYYQGRLVASFVGFVPADDPRLVILVVLYDVAHGHFGGLYAAPVFSEIAAAALDRLGVAPPQAPPSYDTASLVPFGSDNAREPVALRIADSPAALAPEQSGGGIPDFLGASMRDALALARARGLTLEIKGHGYVVAQSPAPGRNSGAAGVRLTLADDPAVIAGADLPHRAHPERRENRFISRFARRMRP